MNVCQIEHYLFEHGYRKQSGGNWKHSDNKNIRYNFYNITLRLERKRENSCVWVRVESGRFEDLRVVGDELRGMK